MAKATLLDVLCSLRHCGLHLFGRTADRRRSPGIAWIFTIVIMQVLALIGSTITNAKAADQKYAVEVAFKYKAGERTSHEWRAFFTALDKCHAQGYQDAYLVGEPKITCQQPTGNECSLFLAIASYDCFGMGYQPE